MNRDYDDGFSIPPKLPSHLRVKHSKNLKVPVVIKDYCNCRFVMIMRGDDGLPYCSECKKEVDE